MTAPTAGEVTNEDVLRSMRGVRRWLLVTVLATGAAIGTQYLVSEEARERICGTVRDAFEAEHEELGESFGLAPDDPKVRDLDARVQARLEDCG